MIKCLKNNFHSPVVRLNSSVLKKLSAEERDILKAFETAILDNDLKAFKSVFPKCQNISKDIFKSNELFVYCDDLNLKHTQGIEVLGVIGFYGRAAMLDECAHFYSNDPYKDVRYFALKGALLNPQGDDMVKYIFRHYKPMPDYVQPKVLLDLIDRQNYEMLSFLLAYGVNPDYFHHEEETGFYHLPYLHAFNKNDVTAMQCLLLAGSRPERIVPPLSDRVQRNQTDAIDKVLKGIQLHHSLMKEYAQHLITINIDSIDSLAGLRTQTMPFQDNGSINLILAIGCFGDFGDVLRLKLKTGEIIHRNDLYDRNNFLGVSVMDMLRHKGKLNQMFQPEIWNGHDIEMEKFHAMLDPYDRYVTETALKNCSQIIMPPLKRLQILRKKMNISPLKRRPKPAKK